MGFLHYFLHSSFDTEVCTYISLSDHTHTSCYTLVTHLYIHLVKNLKMVNYTSSTGKVLFRIVTYSSSTGQVLLRRGNFSSRSVDTEDGWLYISVGAFIVLLYLFIGCFVYLLDYYILTPDNGQPGNKEQTSPPTVTPFRRSRNRAMRKRTQRQPVTNIVHPDISHWSKKDTIQFSSKAQNSQKEKLTWL